ncbi:acetyl-CoA carboxylase biotin carboxyl carrier protein [Blattabacterium cuenoti]|uniref:acetyl-CoA carboxylase biotin carboxyl carrier protein n=1 Tax=Blattabacterium cuenoti TaxID=1653831 RepID=UPI00163BED5C|nr:acetyl-CoA carboxylase biotin carboxyl carrier protein [Blattabacterium cuenoti]
MDLKNIQSFIQFISQLEIDEIKIKIGETKIYIKNKIVNQKNKKSLNPILRNISTSYRSSDISDRFSKLESELKDDKKNKFQTIQSPMIGTFYRKPHPDKKPFVKIGDNIKIGTKVCVIEAMKLFNDIESEVEGKIIKILVEDASPVDYDQPLFIILTTS